MSKLKSYEVLPVFFLGKLLSSSSESFPIPRHFPQILERFTNFSNPQKWATQLHLVPTCSRHLMTWRIIARKEVQFLFSLLLKNQTSPYSGILVAFVSYKWILTMLHHRDEHDELFVVLQLLKKILGLKPVNPYEFLVDFSGQQWQWSTDFSYHAMTRRSQVQIIYWVWECHVIWMGYGLVTLW